MEIGIRIFALILDLGFGLGTYFLVLNGTAWILNKLGYVGVVLSPLIIVIFFIWPILYLSIPTGIWGKTLGKLICRLSVTDYRGNPPGFWRALGREVLKCLAIASGIGATIVLVQIIYQGTTWYDNICGTQVNFNPYVRLTKTQKNWRKIVNKK
jgi:uncharacterized RDD family membrane protein YckC